MAMSPVLRAARRIECSYREDAKRVEDMLRGAKGYGSATDEMEGGGGVEVAS